MKKISREEQLEILRRRYEHRKTQGKSVILDELCEEYKFHRKHAVRLMNAVANAPGQPILHLGPEPRYESIAPVLETIWKAAEQPCGKRLVEALPLWVPFYQKRYETLTAKQRKLLGAISSASVQLSHNCERVMKGSVRQLCFLLPSFIDFRQFSLHFC